MLVKEAGADMLGDCVVLGGTVAVMLALTPAVRVLDAGADVVGDGVGAALMLTTTAPVAFLMMLTMSGQSVVPRDKDVAASPDATLRIAHHVSLPKERSMMG